MATIHDRMEEIANNSSQINITGLTRNSNITLLKSVRPYSYTDELTTKLVLDKVKYEGVLFNNSIGIGLNGTLASHDYSNVNNLPIVGQFINAIDINWNNPFITPISGQSLYMGITTTSDLLNYIKESFTFGQSNPDNLVLQDDAIQEINNYKNQINELKNNINKILNRRISFISYAYLNRDGAEKPYEIEDCGRKCLLNIPSTDILYSNGEYIFAYFKCEKNIENYESYFKFNITGNVGQTNINSQIDWTAVGSSVKSIQISNGINLYLNIKSASVHQYISSSTATMYSYTISAKEANGIDSLGDKNVNLTITPVDSDGIPADKSLNFSLYIDVPTTFKGFIIPYDFRLDPSATDSSLIPSDDYYSGKWFDSIYNINNDGLITGFNTDLCKDGIIKIAPGDSDYNSLYLSFEYYGLIQYYDNNSSSWKDIGAFVKYDRTESSWAQDTILYNTDITNNDPNLFNEFKQYLYSKALSDVDWNYTGSRQRRNQVQLDEMMVGVSFSSPGAFSGDPDNNNYIGFLSNSIIIGNFKNAHQTSKVTTLYDIDIYQSFARKEIPTNVFSSFGLKPYGTSRKLYLRQPYSNMANIDFSSPQYGFRNPVTTICTERDGDNSIVYSTGNMFNSPSNKPNIDFGQLKIEQQADKKMHPGFKYIATDLNESSEIIGNYGAGTCYGHAPFIIYKINGSLYTFVNASQTDKTNKVFVKINSGNINHYANNFSTSLTTDPKTSGAKVFVNYFDSSESRYTKITDRIQITAGNLDIEVQVYFYYDQAYDWWDGSKTEEFTIGNYGWWKCYTYKPEIELHEGYNNLTNLPGLTGYTRSNYQELERSILNDTSQSINLLFQGEDVTDKIKNGTYTIFDSCGLNHYWNGGHSDFAHCLESRYYGTKSEFAGQNIIYLNNISQ